MMQRNTLFPPHPQPYPEEVTWRGWMIRVIDGDTVAVKIDLGFRSSIEIDVRIKDLDTPEVVGSERAAGLAASLFVESLAPPGTPLRITTYKMRRSFNRYVAIIQFWTGSSWENLADRVIAAGHGRFVG